VGTKGPAAAGKNYRLPGYTQPGRRGNRVKNGDGIPKVDGREEKPKGGGGGKIFCKINDILGKEISQIVTREEEKRKNGRLSHPGEGRNTRDKG